MKRRKKHSRRTYQRKPLKIRAWLVEHGIAVKDVATLAGLKQPVTSQTIYGTRNSPSVLRALLDVGVPEEFLDLPENFEREPGRTPAT